MIQACKKLDLRSIGSMGRVLKLIQYSTRFLYFYLRILKLKLIYKEISFIRRGFRFLRTLSALRNIIRMMRDGSAYGARSGRFVYNIMMLVFLNLDMLIFFYQLGVIENRKLIGKLFYWMD